MMDTTFQFDSGSVTVPHKMKFDGKYFELWGVQEVKNKTAILNTKMTLQKMKSNGIYKQIRQKSYQNGRYVAFYYRK